MWRAQRGGDCVGAMGREILRHISVMNIDDTLPRKVPNWCTFDFLRSHFVRSL
jgi:hypothetical protein